MLEHLRYSRRHTAPREHDTYYEPERDEAALAHEASPSNVGETSVGEDFLRSRFGQRIDVIRPSRNGVTAAAASTYPIDPQRTGVVGLCAAHISRQTSATRKSAAISRPTQPTGILTAQTSRF